MNAYMRKLLRVVSVTTIVLVGSIGLGGCASGGKLSKAMDSTLQAVGLRESKPEKPPVIPLKIYHLRSAQRFEQATFNAFLDQAGEQAALGADLLSVNEVVLTPGVRQELSEQLSDGTAVIGVVALFRSPAENRWRMAFDARTKNLPSDGITIGVHACALTTDSSALSSRISGDPGSLASVRCAGAR